ncbi:hypothetical protein HGG72_02140 [Ochrobactrum pecoris]|uniref:Uncharacterized protein n=1 Tax=Brucella pecoris TaxID=867683 RepID=A0A5C5CNX6_9HYPH|nr:hypothetical protein [Brucella pecoris]MBB4093909.1 hypothetical protein [Brucella pecoris]NKW79394.1 hypothetical protein [Brucella pecoris]TNV12721.1 hypothetical protein FIB18_09235 [Brucella pecoris]
MLSFKSEASAGIALAAIERHSHDAQAPRRLHFNEAATNQTMVQNNGKVISYLFNSSSSF